MSTVPLPGSLRGRLRGVARRLRRLHVLRGLSVLVLVLSLLAGGAFLLDGLLCESLPGVARGGLLAVFAGLGTVCAVGLIRALFRPLDAAALAALIEQKYPELGERLTSSVELSQSADAGNGSPALIALLAEETEARTQPLDLRSAIPGRSTGVLAGLAAVALLATVTPAAVAPAEYGRLAQRFFLPWQTPAPLPDFTFVVKPGEAVAARGRPLTVTATLTPRHSGIDLPATVTLLMEPADGSPTRHEMKRDGDQYTLTFRVPGDLTYTVHAGNAASAGYFLDAVTPVDLAADSPEVTVTPPSYAGGVYDPETLTGLVDLTALRHSQLGFRFRFDRPAVSAKIEWKHGEATQLIPLTLSADKQSADYTLAAQENGSYRLLLEAEHGVVTERDGGTLTVRADQPPAMLKFAGKEEPRSARVFDRVPVEFRLADDIAIADAVIEYRVNTATQVQEEKVILDGAGGREAVGRHLFQLAGKAKVGDELHYRVRYRDNLPKEYGGPHVAYYPADGWLKLRITADGGSLKEQDIRARRDAINRKIDELRAELKQEQRKAMTARNEARAEKNLSDKTADAIAGLQELNRKNEKALRDFAQELEQERPLAEKAREVAEQEMKQADEALRDAADRTARQDTRDRRLRDTEDELARAINKLDHLKDANDQLARDRADQAKVESLADRQKQLAEKADELVKKDPAAREQLDQLKREQEAVAQELKRLAESSEALKKALDEARAEQAREAGEKAKELAQAQRDLAKASEETEKAGEKARLADLARKQEELAKKADALAKDTARPAKANFAKPLQPEDTAKAAASLNKGETEKAMQEQDRSARELDRLAADLDRGAEVSKDPKNAARQLARLEEELAKRTRDSGKLDELKREQQAIREAAEKLSVPPGKRDAEIDKKKATEALAQAEKALDEKNVAEALAQMDKARQALRDLSAKLPTLEDRRAKAREELAQLTKEQDEVAKKSRDLTKQPEAARKQEQLAERLRKLDAPGAEERRDQAADAAKKAAEELRGGKKFDAAASQAQAKREQERLAQKLAGQTPPDEKAAELARRQEELATKPASEATKAQQQKVAEEAKALEPSGSPLKKREAADAAKKAAEETAKAPASKEAQQARADAAKKLDELAKQMNPNAKPEGKKDTTLPSKEQAAEARKLAQEQRELKEATRGVGEKMKDERRAETAKREGNPAEKLAREQADIAKEAAKLAQDVRKEQGEKASPTERAEQANRSAGEAARKLDAGALEQAKQSGEQSARDLQKLAGELAKTGRGEKSPRQGDTLEEARRLTQRQEAVNKALEPIAGDRGAQRAQQDARQEQLRQQAEALGREMEQMGKGAEPDRQASTKEAARATRAAESSMQAARLQSRDGNQSMTQAQRELAAKNLDQAAQQAEQAGRGANPASPTQQAGRLMQEARKEVNRAQAQMSQGQPGEASKTMQGAADSLRQAAEQLAKATGQPAMTGDVPRDGAKGGGTPDGRELPKELAAYSGKKWGELPGEVRTKVVQQMKARYGEDYARMIKLYFEQIADTRGRK